MTRDEAVLVPSKFKARDKRVGKSKNKKLGEGGYRPFIDKGKAKQIEASMKKAKPNVGCFICGGPHYAKEYPKREKLNAILIDESETEETVTHINPIRVLNYLVTQVDDSVDESSPADIDLVYLDVLRHGKLGVMDTLMYVKIRVNDMEINAMLDSGAMDTFVADMLVM